MVITNLCVFRAKRISSRTYVEKGVRRPKRCREGEKRKRSRKRGKSREEKATNSGIGRVGSGREEREKGWKATRCADLP